MVGGAFNMRTTIRYPLQGLLNITYINKDTNISKEIANQIPNQAERVVIENIDETEFETVILRQLIRDRLYRQIMVSETGSEKLIDCVYFHIPGNDNSTIQLVYNKDTREVEITIADIMDAISKMQTNDIVVNEVLHDKMGLHGNLKYQQRLSEVEHEVNQAKATMQAIEAMG